MTAKLASVDKYVLRIAAGPDYNTLKLLSINDELHPLHINNDHFTGYLLVRVNNFDGVTPQMEAGAEKRGTGHNPISKPASKYFKGRNRRYSLVLQGRFKKEWTGDDVVFGVDTIPPVYPIPGISFGLRICKFLDPSLEAELSGPQPHIYSPLIASMNALGIFKMDELLNEHLQRHDPTAPASPLKEEPPLLLTSPTSPKKHKRKSKKSPTTSTPVLSYRVCGVAVSSPESGEMSPHPYISTGDSDPVDIGAWAFASSGVPERTGLLFASPTEGAKCTSYPHRKKVYSNVEKRRNTLISPDHLYCMDFCDAYFDLSSFAVVLPGFSISAFKYWDGDQPLRYVCKSRNGETVFFVVEFTLVPRTDYPGLAPLEKN